MTDIFLVTHNDGETHVDGATATFHGAKALVAELFDYIGEPVPVPDQDDSTWRYAGHQVIITVQKMEVTK